MKNYFKLLFVILLLLSAANSMAQTRLIVHRQNGDVQNFTITEQGKLYFSETELFIDEGTGTPTSILFSEIRKVNVEKLASIPEHSTEENTILCPNPATDFIQFYNLTDKKVSFKLYSLLGILVKRGTYEPNSQMDVSTLAPGVYIIKIAGRTFKFRKL